VAFVERLVGLAEALEVDCDDPVALGEGWRDAAPSIGAGAEAVDEEYRRAFALLLVEQLDRGIRWAETREAGHAFGRMSGRSGHRQREDGRGKADCTS